MANVLKSGVFTLFDKHLGDKRKVPHLRGFDDFVSRVPGLAFMRLTDCQPDIHTDCCFFSDGAGKLSYEMPERVKYKDFHFYWGVRDGDITTRMEIPVTAPAVLVPQIEDALAVILPRSFAGHPQWTKFAQGKIMDLRMPCVGVRSSLADKADSVCGAAESYWRSLWYNSLNPMIATVLEYHKNGHVSF